MEVVFYYNASDDRVINKVLVGGTSFQGVPRDEVSIMYYVFTSTGAINAKPASGGDAQSVTGVLGCIFDRDTLGVPSIFG